MIRVIRDVRNQNPLRIPDLTNVIRENKNTYVINMSNPRIVSFKVDPSELEVLDYMTKMLGFNSRSEFIRCCIAFALDNFIMFQQYANEIRNKNTKQNPIQQVFKET